MPKSSENNFANYFALPNPGLVSYFDKTRKGNDIEYRTTFYKSIPDVHDVVSKWIPTLGSLSKEWPSLYQYEIDLAKKVGPMSIQKPLAERMEDIDSYYDSILLESEPISEKAIAAVASEWSKLGGLHLRSQVDTVKLMKKSTNSGSPFFTKRRAVVSKTIPIRLEKLGVNVKMLMNSGDWLGTAVLGWRGQEGGPSYDDVKQRVVWMFPFGINICELQYYQPAIEVAQRNGYVPAWVSMDTVDQRITSMFDTKGKSDLVVCTDFEKFDQHFNQNMQDAALSIIRRWSGSLPEMVKWLYEVYPVKYNIPLAYDMNRIRVGSHGMASGSGGTNFDETLSHRALQYEAAQSVGARLNPNSQCLGDDGVLTYPNCSVDEIVKVYSKHGLVMNESKQESAVDYCTYLRRWHHSGYRQNDVCVGVYSTCRALGRLCEQERYYDPEIWGPKMVALRQLSILQNCEYHPLREEFAQFCMKGDKYRLGVDIPGFLDDLDRFAKEATDVLPDFIGYNQSQVANPRGISDWWIVKYLKNFKS